MTIAVCIKQVPSREWQPAFDTGARWVREADATFEMNEPDQYALEAALRLRETHGGQVLACAFGPSRVTHVLREALARGADAAVHVQHEEPASVDGTIAARGLADALAGEHVDLVLAGLQSDDTGLAQTGVLLAEFLGLPHATIIMDVQVADGVVRVKRELEGGWFEWVTLPLPAVLTIQSGINQLRYATLKGIMAAKKKTIRVVTAQPVAPRVRIAGLRAPVAGKRTQRIEGAPAAAARELVRRLREETRVL